MKKVLLDFKLIEQTLIFFYNLWAMSVSLLLIDPQNDFCSSKGSLFVPGAEEDSKRLSAFIEKNVSKFNEIYVTLDCHPYFHIAHPNFWVDRNGKEVEPYTTITHTDFENGVYTPALLGLKPRVDEYLMSLENQGRYQLTIWPPHCVLGSEGFGVFPEVLKSLNSWEKSKAGNSIDYIIKSKNPLTEHYSAIRAEVQDPEDVSTRINYQFIEKLKKDDMIYVCGEALSHCVANTLKDLFVYISPRKVTLIRDCTSSVKGYEKVGDEFVDEYVSKGMNIINSDQLI